MDSPAKNTVASARLDLIRGLAASFVVWDHIGKLFFNPVTAETKHHLKTSLFFWTMEQGYTAVAAFFVLSGFLIGGAVKRMLGKGWDWPKYLIARICRLCVPLVPAFLVCGLIDYVGAQTFGVGWTYAGQSPTHGVLTGAITGGNVLHQLTWPTLLGNLCFLETMTFPVVGHVANWGSDGPLWSLACEFWYYMYWPLMALAIYLRKASQKTIVIVLLIAILALTGRWILPLFVIWVLGAVIAIAKFPIKRMTFWGTGACWAFFIAILAFKWFGPTLTHHIPDYLTGIGFSVALVGTVLSPAAEQHAKRNWFIAWSSNISYTLYLVHYPLLMFFSAWLVGSRPMFSLTPANIGIAGGILLAAWVFATIMWWIAERNTDKVRAWAERMWHNRTRPVHKGIASP